VWAISADGGVPMVPGPLLRGEESTRFVVTVENPRRDSALFVTGLGTRPGGGELVRVAPGSDTTISFVAGAAGSYFYRLAWSDPHREITPADESLLAGALIIDAPGAPVDDQVFLISSWYVPIDSALGPPYVTRDWMVINGRSFPYNPEITLQQGDSVRWRWINASHDAHPIHLHGDYFRLTELGSMTENQAHWPQEVVTQLLKPGETFTAVYRPSEPGNWVIHCHFAFHTSHFLSTERVAVPDDPGAPDVVDHSVHGMKGMLIPIRVAPREGGSRREVHDDDARRMRIVVQGRPGIYRDVVEGMAFIPVAGSDPAPDSIPIPSPTLVLRRGEPVAITVVNRMRSPTAVHWHGIELPSYSDGVPGLSGLGDRIAQVIAPGDSFTAEFTPPRAGTFIYHAHSNESHQINGGLYGALLVVDPGTYRPESERLVIVGGDGFFAPGVRVNGSLAPEPIALPHDVPIRFRLIDIQADFRVFMQLQRSDGTPVPWTRLAKDGAELPISRQVSDTLPWISGPGETADYEIRLPRGSYTLMVRQVFDEWMMPVEVTVR
ncbi:MAG TPA: multicopper oxidase domain-containing protein, partial [Gemmatimonadales bacterium]|nr:multicopper oxidase domain-containing protein [Gemmatimonadales bacterium]